MNSTFNRWFFSEFPLFPSFFSSLWLNKLLAIYFFFYHPICTVCSYPLFYISTSQLLIFLLNTFLVVTIVQIIIRFFSNCTVLPLQTYSVLLCISVLLHNLHTIIILVFCQNLMSPIWVNYKNPCSSDCLSICFKL